jgi:hypothetical protein
MLKEEARGTGPDRPPELGDSIVPPSKRISALRILGRVLVLEEGRGESMLAKPIRVNAATSQA